MGATLKRAAALERHVELEWSDGGGPARLSSRWLADHRSDDLDPLTHQRRRSPCEPAAELRRARVVDGGLEVVWDDGSAARYPLSVLRPKQPRRRHVSRWDAALATRLPSVSFERIADDRGLLELLEAIERWGFAQVTGTPATPDDTRRLAERIGYLRRTIFGDFWDFGPDGSRDDTAYRRDAIGPHTDGTYAHDPPGLQTFHCLQPAASGGHTILVDGFEIAARLRRDDPDAYALLRDTPVPGRYIGDGHQLIAEAPTFRHDGDELVQVRLNDADRAPFHPPDGFYDAWCAARALALDPAFHVRFLLTPGTVLVFDNWRVLHGRERFEGARRIVGCYHNREDLESRLRTLRQTLDQSPS